MKIFTNFMQEQFERTVLLDSEIKNKPISIFYDYTIRSLDELNHNPYNILIIQEPNEFFGYHDWAISNSKYFDGIFTWSEKILKLCENAEFFPFAAGDLLLSTKYHSNKTFEVSFMCGPKNMVEGHRMRHSIYNSQSVSDIPKKYIFKGDKLPCWDSMFHIAVENTKYNGYFTEKIVEACFTKTIPIYWGCPDIGNYFNKDGIITFNNQIELETILNNLTPELYHSKKEVLEENYQRAIKWMPIMNRIGELVKQICILNEI